MAQGRQEPVSPSRTLPRVAVNRISMGPGRAGMAMPPVNTVARGGGVGSATRAHPASPYRSCHDRIRGRSHPDRCGSAEAVGPCDRPRRSADTGGWRTPCALRALRHQGNARVPSRPETEEARSANWRCQSDPQGKLPARAAPAGSEPVRVLTMRGPSKVSHRPPKPSIMTLRPD
jgi:hypothetical protein